MVLTPQRAQLKIALASAWTQNWYFRGRSQRSGMLSFTPRGNPLYPSDRTSFVGPTMTEPTFVDGSLDLPAVKRARSRYHLSQLSLTLLEREGPVDDLGAANELAVHRGALDEQIEVGEIPRLDPAVDALRQAEERARLVARVDGLRALLLDQELLRVLDLLRLRQLVQDRPRLV